MKVLIVCTGNICRSPAAELLLRHRLDPGSGDITIESAGTDAMTGEHLHPQMARLIRDVDAPTTPFAVRQLTPAMIASADVVLTMTRAQRATVLVLAPKALRKTFTLVEFAAMIAHSGRFTSIAELAASRPFVTLKDEELDIPDPYRRNVAAYRKAFGTISDAVDAIAAALAPQPEPSAAGDRLTVLESFPVPRATTNPYIVMLGRSLQETPGLTMHNFSYRTALTGHYDVFHVHWPEILVSGNTWWKKRIRQMMFGRLLRRLRRRRIPIVRTVHNLELPSGISKREIALLTRAEEQTTLSIAINDTTPIPDGRASAVILHGHYRDWYGRESPPEAEPGRIAFFGLVRRYKGVDSLITAFRQIPESTEVSLAIAGRPSSDELVSDLRELAGQDERIDLRFGFLDDDDLADHVSRAELVVLPYREMHNSGGVLTALSLARPVLVPANATNTALADEVGHAWIQTYYGELTGSDITRALEAVRADCDGVPDLARREWSLAGPEHAAAFRRAVEILRG